MGEEESTSDCEGRGEAFAPGLAAATNDGQLRVSVVEASPEIPSNTDNFWTLELTSESEERIDDATIVAVPYMVDHGHGTAPQVATSIGDGRYDLGPLTLTMPGFWEVTLEVTPPGSEKTSAIYAICVQPK